MRLRHYLLLALLVIFSSCSSNDPLPDDTDKAVIPPKGMRIKVLTYNIWGASGYESSAIAQQNLDDIASVIKGQDPDFVCLQEVDSATTRSGKDVFQAKDIADRIGYGYAYVVAQNFSGGGFGDAVLYKKKYTDVAKMEYHMPPSDPGIGENRSVCMLKVHLDSIDTDLYVGSTHLDHRSDESSRILQADSLKKIVSSLDGDVILAGDLNAHPDSKTIEIIKSFMNTGYPSETQYTFSALESNPTVLIDYILFTPLDNFTVQNYNVVMTAHASDHYPVSATFKIKK